MIEEDGIGVGDEEAHNDGTRESDNTFTWEGTQALIQRLPNNSTLNYSVVGELKGYEWYIQCSNVTYAKVCHFFHLQC